jgi:hypothetical protein
MTGNVQQGFSGPNRTLQSRGLYGLVYHSGFGFSERRSPGLTGAAKAMDTITADPKPSQSPTLFLRQIIKNLHFKLGHYLPPCHHNW